MQEKKRALEKAGGEGVGSQRFMALWRQLFCPASCPGAVGCSGRTRLEPAPRQEPDPAGTQWGHSSCQIPRTSQGHWSYTHLSQHGCLVWDHHTAEVFEVVFLFLTGCGRGCLIPACAGAQQPAHAPGEGRMGSPNPAQQYNNNWRYLKMYVSSIFPIWAP